MHVGRGVYLVPEAVLCDAGRRVPGRTPFVHFYGLAQWLGKTQISRWVSMLLDSLPRSQRGSLTEAKTLVSKARRKSTSKANVKIVRQRQKNIASITAARGGRVRIQGRVYRSIREATRETGLDRKIVRKIRQPLRR